MDDYMSKPAPLSQLQELLELLERWLPKPTPKQTLRPSHPAPCARSPPGR